MRAPFSGDAMLLRGSPNAEVDVGLLFGVSTPPVNTYWLLLISVGLKRFRMLNASANNCRFVLSVNLNPLVNRGSRLTNAGVRNVLRRVLPGRSVARLPSWFRSGFAPVISPVYG